MSSVSQIIPNFIGGINDQPDELKKPGQVRDAVNMIPDVVKGLYKRPGYEQVGMEIRNADGGSWTTMFSDESDGDKRFIFHISDDGIVRAWDADTGDEKKVLVADGAIDLSLDEDKIKVKPDNTPAFSEYFEQTDITKLKFASKENTIFVTNPEAVPSMTGSEVEGVVRPYEAFIEITTVDESRGYPLTIDFIEENGDREKQVTGMTLDAQVNFSSYDKLEDNGGNCSRLTGIYNLTSKPNEDFPDASPVNIRVEIRANPVAMKSYTRCKYYVYDMQILTGGKGWKKGALLSFDIPAPGADPNDMPALRYEVTDVARFDKGVEEAIDAIMSTDNVSADEILRDWKGKIRALKNQNGNRRFWKCQIVGNGLYISNLYEPFIVDTTEKDLINILSSTAEEADDWEEKYNKDLANNTPDMKPRVRYKYPNPCASVNNASDLPIECRAGFICKVENTYSDQDDYYVRFVNNYTYGDDDDGKQRSSGQGYWQEVAKPNENQILDGAKMPHIIKRLASRDAFVIGNLYWAPRKIGTKKDNPSFIDSSSPINNLFFYRNRLMLLAGESVVSSQADDFTNLFPVTAVTSTPRDPIDITADTDYSSKLHAGIVINNAAVIFSEFQQFMLTTDGDVFDARTAKMSQISKFHFDINSEPFILDTNIGFKGGSQDGAKIYEMTNLFREGQVDAIERSKLVYNTLRDRTNYSMLETSRETGTLYMAGEGKDEMFVYKYFKEGSQKDLMTSWVRWELPEPIAFHFTARDNHYAVIKDGIDWGYIVKMVPNREEEKYVDEVLDRELPVRGSISLPKLYVVKSEQQAFRADTTASTTIHRIKLNTGDTNYYIASIDRFGKDPYEVEYEQTLMDGYIADETPVTKDREETIQLYERNTNLDIKLTSPIGPFQLYSMRWEGDYNSRYYQRV